MVRGTSQSQSSTSAKTRPTGTVEPRGSTIVIAKMRCHKLGGSGGENDGGGGSEGFCGGRNGSNMLSFYTNDALGLKITLTVILMVSVCFIGFVTTLHIFGKLYLYQSGAAF